MEPLQADDFLFAVTVLVKPELNFELFHPTPPNRLQHTNALSASSAI